MQQLPSLNEIENSNDFLKYINKFEISTLNLKKIKNFLIACIEGKSAND